MHPKTMTKIFIVAVIACITVFDVIIFSRGGTESTISWTIFEWSHEHPVVAFAMGFVMGHLFWQMKGLEKIRDSLKQSGEKK